METRGGPASLQNRWIARLKAKFIDELKWLYVWRCGSRECSHDILSARLGPHPSVHPLESLPDPPLLAVGVALSLVERSGKTSRSESSIEHLSTRSPNPCVGKISKDSRVAYPACASYALCVGTFQLQVGESLPERCCRLNTTTRIVMGRFNENEKKVLDWRHRILSRHNLLVKTMSLSAVKRQ